MARRHKYFHYQVKQGSQEWLDLRKNRVTASHAAACLGLSRWTSPQKAYRQIIGEEESASNWYMRNGREKEPAAVSAYEYENGLMCAESGFWVREDTPWLGASPDRLVHEDGLLEVKTSVNDHKDIEIEWLVQSVIQLHCTGRQWCDVVWYRGILEQTWRVYPNALRKLVPRLFRFHETFIVPRRCPKRGEVQSWE